MAITDEEARAMAGCVLFAGRVFLLAAVYATVALGHQGAAFCALATLVFLLPGSK